MSGNGVFEPEFKRGRGRPIVGEPFDIQLKGRISRTEQDMIDHILIETDYNKSELLRKMIRTYYHMYYGKW